MLIKKEQLNNAPIHSYSKKQKNIIALSSFIAGLGLLAVAGIGYLFYFFVFVKNTISIETMWGISGAALLLTIVSMLFFSFSQPSFLKYAFIFTIYIFSSGIGFSSLFAIFSGAELLMIFGVAGITMFISAILGYILPTNIIGSLFKFSMLLMMFLIIFSLAFSLITVYSFSSYNLPTWSIVVTVLMAVICVIYNIFLFHSMSRMQSFQGEEIDNKSFLLISLSFAFSLLVSIIQLIWIIARLYYYFK